MPASSSNETPDVFAEDDAGDSVQSVSHSISEVASKNPEQPHIVSSNLDKTSMEFNCMTAFHLRILRYQLDGFC